MGANKKTKGRKKELWNALMAAWNTYDKALIVDTNNLTSCKIT